MNFKKNITWIKINKTKNNLDIHLILSQIRRKCMKMKKDNKRYRTLIIHLVQIIIIQI